MKLDDENSPSNNFLQTITKLCNVIKLNDTEEFLAKYKIVSNEIQNVI